MRHLTTTEVRYSNKTNETGCEITLNQTLRDILKVEPGTDSLDWYLDSSGLGKGRIVVRKKAATPRQPSVAHHQEDGEPGAE